MAAESIRRRAGFKKHLHQTWPGREATTTVDIVLAADGSVPTWIAEATKMIPEWRADIHDVYTRWAITINAMHVARDRYAERHDLALTTMGMRNRNGQTKQVVLDTWSSVDAARNYELAMPLLSAYALTDMFGLLEEIVFDLYLIFLNDNPDTLMQGPEFRELRRLYKRREQGTDTLQEWEAAWSKRLSEWRLKQGYKGLHTTFLAIYEKAKLKRPSGFGLTTVEDWALTIEAIAEARNLIIHGVGEVSDRLAALSHSVVGNGFQFTKGDELNITLQHLMFVELFYQQLLNAVGTGLVEKVHGPMDQYAEK